MAIPKFLHAALEPIVRALFPFGSKRRVLFGPARGMQYYVAPGMGLHYAIPRGDPFGLRFFSEHVRPGMVVYDIGANLGQESLHFSRLVGATGRVFAFEPYPPAREGLHRNLAINGLSNVSVHGEAVADRCGEVTLTFDPSRPTESSLTPGQHKRESLVVPSITLDEAKLLPPDLMKIDVEGAARFVLQGARRLLDEHKPDVYLELHTTDEQAAVNECLLSRGYQARTLSGELITDATAQWATPLWITKRT